MNAASKTRLSSLLTGLAGFIVIIQAIPLSIPPFTPEGARVIGGTLALLSVLCTYAKQHFSAEVTDKGKNLTLLLIGLPTVIIALGDFINLFKFSEGVSHWLTFALSSLLMIVNNYSRLLFPSDYQKDKNEELKTVPEAKTK